MSYSMSGALQAAVYQALMSNAALTALVGPDVYDAVPTGTVPETYVSLGRERVQDASDQTGDGALHRFEISVITTKPGFAGIKAVAACISDVLHGADLTMARGSLVYLRFEHADARRIDASSGREILMRFKARVDDQ